MKFIFQYLNNPIGYFIFFIFFLMETITSSGWFSFFGGFWSKHFFFYIFTNQSINLIYYIVTPSLSLSLLHLKFPQNFFPKSPNNYNHHQPESKIHIFYLTVSDGSWCINPFSFNPNISLLSLTLSAIYYVPFFSLLN